ncbi:MAG: UvrD-helicase domain-containing protein [Succinatimonas sp.]|nr:UvrD-helicase domain-containing protein [Succinatimonas sp.]
MSKNNENKDNDFKPEQLNLAGFDLDKSSMIEASAGTGKTFTISNLVVRLLIEGLKNGNHTEPLDIENILIVTFTNAAASDLRARVLQKIHESRISFDQIKNGIKTIEDFESPFKDIAIKCFEKYLENTIDAIDVDKLKDTASVFSRLLTRAERNIDRASISTIHSFCNKALNQIYSFEAGRAFNVNLTQDISLEQKEAKLAVWRSLFYNDNGFDRDLLLNLLGFTDPEGDTLKNAVKAIEKVRLIDPNECYYGFSVKSYYEEGVKKLQKTPDERLKYLLDTAKDLYSDFENDFFSKLESLKEYKDQIISFADGNTVPGSLYELSPGGSFYSNPFNKGLPCKNFLNLLVSTLNNDSADIINYITSFNSIDKIVALSEIGSDEHFFKVKKSGEFKDSQKVRDFEEIVKDLISASFEVITEIELIKLELTTLVAINVILKTDELCERDNVISNDEVLRQLAVALNNNKDKSRGDVLSSLLRKRYPVAMIDEFQDTDPVQFAIFSKLYLNQDAIDESAHCYLIGDPKQSIYAFRGTDINSYNKAKELILGNKGNVYTLNTNYRSCQNIIKGVNEIFYEYEEPKTQESSEGSFSNIESQNSEESLSEKKVKIDYPYVKNPFDYYNNSGKEGYLDSKIHFEPVNFSDKANSVRFYFKDDSSKEIPICNYIREVSFADSQETPKANDYYGEIAKFVALDVKRCLLEGKIFENGEERDVKPSDITILVNDAKENSFIQDALKKQSIQSVYFSDKESVINSEDKNYNITVTEEAANVIYLMEAMCDSTNSPKVNRLLGSSLLRLSSEKFLDSIKSDKLDSEITLLRVCRDSWEKYGFITAFSQYIYQHDLLCTILETDGGERSLSNYFQIAEIVQSVNSKVVGSNAQLLWFKELVLNNKGELSEDVTKKHLESEQSLVKVMTIHKSKGLEFPIVFTPYESGFMALKSKDSAIYYDPDSKQVSYALDRENKIIGKSVKDLVEVAALQEQERLLYVALTRAKLANFITLPSCVSLERKPYQSPLKKLISLVSKDDSADSKGKPSKRTTKKSKDKEVEIDTTKDVVVADPQPTLKAVENPELFKKLETVELDESIKVQNSISQDCSVSSLDKGAVDNSFTVTSYSAITSGAHNDMFASSADEKETSVEDGDSDDSKDKDLINFNFAKGSTAGSFLHKLMEIVLAKDDVDKADKDSLYNFVNSQLKYDFYHLVSKPGDDEDTKNEKIVALSQWLYDILNANLLPKAKDGNQVKLSNLKAFDCARELDYFLPCKDFKVRVLNGICHDFYESEVKAFELTSIPELPDLKKSNFKGFMNGSLDLVAKFVTETGPKFYMIDYKSNYLGNSYSRYTQQKILKSIFESRYDVQILFYSLALYRFLKTSLPNFSYENDFGGVMYLYLRGMNSFDARSSGQFYVKPSEALIERLDKLFNGINEDTADNSDEGEE